MKKRIIGILMGIGLCVAAQAASDSWNVDANGDWTNSVNWLGGNIPGSTVISNSADVATFDYVLTTNRVVAVDTNRNVGGISFGGASVFPYELSGGTFVLSNGGTIQRTATVGLRTDRIETGILIDGENGTATIRNDNAGNNAGLVIAGEITGNSTAGNTTTITLDGVSTANSTGAKNNSLTKIGDGTAGGKVKLVKNGTGLWTVGIQTTTFSGGFDINAGTVRYFAGGNRGFGTGTVNINADVVFNHANGTALTITNNFAVNGNVSFNGSGNTTWGGTMDLGGGSRSFASGTAATSTNTISGTITNGQLTALGKGPLILTATNTFDGTITVGPGASQLAVYSDENLGAATNILILQNSVFSTLDSFATSKDISPLPGAGSAAIDVADGTVLTLNGRILHSGALTQATKKGLGMLVLNSGNNTWQSTKYFLISNGGLSLGNSNALNGCALKYNGGDQLANSSGAAMAPNGLLSVSLTTGFQFIGDNDLDLSAIPVGFVQTAGTTRFLNIVTNSVTIAGILASGGSDATGAVWVDGKLVKNGAGTLTLTGASGYTLGTLANAGTLVGNVDGAFGTNDVTVADGATLVLQGGSLNDYIGDSADLVLGTNANLNLNFSGTDTINSLSLDGGSNLVAAGVYDAASLGFHGTGTYTGSGTLTVSTGGNNYDIWAAGWGVALGAATDDYDNDGLLNIYEYGLGGNPTNGSSQGNSPVFGAQTLGGTNYFGYIYPKLKDPNSSITYKLALTTDLVNIGWTTNSGYIVYGTYIAPSGDFNYVTNVTTTVESAKFIRLIIE
ncbi:MAG: autotransporter-associated beta strand repeat-containing protein [Kiritimatiellales bacterium]|nr:autotransporter-associated beta strand repeat-containing protein [Kiritimatiellales bacterium]